jgi:hypothetical protein
MSSSTGEDDVDVTQSTYKRRRSGESVSGLADSSINSNSGGGGGGLQSSDHSEAWSSRLGDSNGGYGGGSTQLICNRSYNYY